MNYKKKYLKYKLKYLTLKILGARGGSNSNVPYDEYNFDEFPVYDSNDEDGYDSDVYEEESAPAEEAPAEEAPAEEAQVLPAAPVLQAAQFLLQNIPPINLGEPEVQNINIVNPFPVLPPPEARLRKRRRNISS